MWQNSYLQGKVLDEQLQFWKEYLTEAPEISVFPSDRTRAPFPTNNGATIFVAIDHELARNVRALGRQHKVTSFMTLLTAFQVLLCQYSGQHDVVVGTPIANRQYPELNDVVGMFANTLALRMQIDDTDSFASLLEKVRVSMIDVQAHQDLPFEQLIDALQLKRSVSHSPLFQVMFSLQERQDTTIPLNDLTLSILPVATDTAKFDLALDMEETADSLSGKWEYNTDLFDQETIERIARHFEQILREAVLHPTQLVLTLPLLNTAEREHILYTWNDTERHFVSHDSTVTTSSPTAIPLVHHLFEEQAKKTPDAIAVVYEDASLSYTELNTRANQLAHYLRKLGVAPNRLVGICMERSLEMMVGMLATLKAGGAYVPLDPAYPQERLAYMIEDSSPVILLTQKNLLGYLPDIDGNSSDTYSQCALFCIDSQWPTLASMSTENPASLAGTDDLAYVIYTSGSTGKPKGAMIEHSGLSNYLLWAADVYQAHQGTGSIVNSSFSFDATITSLYTPLLCGRRIVMVRDGEEIDGLEKLLLQPDAWSIVKITPAHLDMLGRRWELTKQPCHVRAFVIGGEALSPSTVELWQRIAPQTRLINEYGPTETVVGCCIYEVPKNWHSASSTPIGKAIANTQLYVLDAQMQPLPPGVAGEIYIGGAGVGRGYLNRPGLTAERFVHNPFSRNADDRMYRTGDLARWYNDGNLEYLGRIDTQVKIRGFRIELGEIEAALVALPTVREVVVLASEDPSRQKRLVAYVTPNAADNVALSASGSHLDSLTLRSALSAVLPEYMVPSNIIVLDAFPLTPNGKIDRKALPAPDFSPTQSSYVAPRTPIEQTLSVMWAEVLNVGQVGINDNFFDLGGHSLLAAQLVSRIRRTYEVELPVRALFEANTIALLAPRIIAQKQQATATQVIAPVSRKQSLPLSFSQQRLWYIHHHVAGLETAYNIPLSMQLDGKLDLAALQAAFDQLILRHEILRTTFSVNDENNGEATQIIHDKASITIDLIEADQASAEDIQRYAKKHAQRIFDLKQGPLLALTLLRIAPERHVLLMNMHHIVSDGWSQGVLTREVSHYYDAFLNKNTLPLPALTIQYADYAYWQRQQDFSNHIDYWESNFGDYENSLNLPFDRSPTANQNSAAAVFRYRYPTAFAKALTQFSRSQHSTLFMSLTMGMLVVLHRYTGQTDIALGTTTAGRDAVELEGLIGFFINILVLRTDLSGNPTGLELLNRVKETALKAFEYQALPFEQVIHALPAQRHKNPTDLLPVMIRHQNFPDVALEGALGDLSMTVLKEDEQQAAKCPIDLQFFGEDDNLEITVEYAADLFNQATIERLIQHHQCVLEELIATPLHRLSDFAVLTSQESINILHVWNKTAKVFDAQTSVPALFEQQVEKTPLAIACITPANEYQGEERVTYAELNQRANRLAHDLRKRGVVPEMRVGLYIERSSAFLAGLLAIFKAGGVYVPMDPDFPKDYVEQILQDAKPAILLTSSRLAQTLTAHIPCICLDVENEENSGTGGTYDNLPLSLEAGHLAYISYTSGSTGRPKGVMVEHRQILNLLHNLWRNMPFGKQDVVVQKTTAVFVVSLKELLSGLLVGRPLVFAATNVVKDAVAFLALLEKYQVTRLNIVPSHLQSLLDHLDDASRLDALTYCITAGEPLTPALYKDATGRLPSMQLWNNYGCTELNDTAYYWKTELDEDYLSVPLGRPIANTRIYLLDSQLHPVPIGVTGELCVDSIGQARGYWAQPALTAERFVPNPYSDIPGARLYKTGDLMRQHHDGLLEYVGRQDFEIKIRGHRIDVRQVEQALNRHPGIKQGLVRAAASAGEPAQLVAYYVVEDGSTPPEHNALYNALKTQLPAYMVPTLYVALDALPRLPNGKIDRKSLPTPQITRDEHSYVAPRTSHEHALATIWSELLKTEKISIHDNFLASGGHSLLAAQLVSRIRTTFGIEISVRTILETGTLETLAAQILQLQENGVQPVGDLAHYIIPKATRDEAILLSYAQLRLWFIHSHVSGQQTAYNMPMALRLRGPLHLEALQAAFNQLVIRHEVLRTVFQTASFDDLNQARADEPVQIIRETQPLHITLIEIDDDEMVEHVKAHASRAFDLQQGPLLTLTLLRLRKPQLEQEHVLLINMHHIISDGWSLGVMTKEISILYDAYLKQQSDPLPPLSLQYADYAVWQRQQDLSPHLAYWKSALETYNGELRFPQDFPRNPNAIGAVRIVRYRYAEALIKKLNQFNRSRQATLFMSLLSGLLIVMHRYTGLEDIVLGTTTAGRNTAELESLIGFFVNILALRFDISNDPTGDEILERVKKTALEGYEHQVLSFEQVLQALPRQHDLNHSSLVPIMIRHQNFPEVAMNGELGDLQTELLNIGEQAAKCDIDMQFYGEGNELEVVIEYAADIFKQESIERLIRQHEHVLSELVETPLRRLSEFAVLTGNEVNFMLHSINNTAYPFDTSLGVSELFEKQVAATPDAVACIYPSENANDEIRMSYRTLNIHANQLAHYLRTEGVKPETRVALHYERSPYFLAALLAIYKAGGVYIPIDPHFPIAYTRQILQDSDATIILTSLALCENFDVTQRTGITAIFKLPDSNENAKLLCIDTFFDTPQLRENWSSDNSPSPLEPQHLAYISYTSGSTGKPKGVMVEHRQILNWLQALWKRMPFESGEMVAQKTTANSTVAIKEFLSGLLVGTPQVFIADQIVKDNESFIKIMDDYRVSRLNVVPSHLQVMVNSLQHSSHSLQSLKYCITAGEPLTQDMRHKIEQALPSVHLWNNYGCTELNDTTYYGPGQTSQGYFSVPIGHPVKNAQVYILDAELRPVPIGVTGELYVSSIGLARGYWRHSSLTAERFIPHPFSKVPGQRLYKTGDLVRMLEDGAIEYIGRQDFEIKIRGNRIDIRQIEQELNQHPGIKQGLVKQWAVPGGSPVLVAYYILQQQGESDRTDRKILHDVALKNAVSRNSLKEILSTRLPSYMVPSLFVELDAFPMLANGKLDRKNLPDPDINAIATTDYVQPQTETESILAGMWGDLLNIPTECIGRQDDFFTLGGHSLLAGQMLTRLRTHFHIELPLSAIFVHPKLCDLATAIDSASQHSLIVSLHTARHAKNLFFVHPVGGQILFYHALSEHLSKTFSVYAIQSPEAAGEKHQTVTTSLEELVNRYITEILSVQPQGPFYLLGWSTGGLFAMVVAKELKIRGHAVNYVGLLDTQPIPDNLNDVELFAIAAEVALSNIQTQTHLSSEEQEALFAAIDESMMVELMAYNPSSENMKSIPHAISSLSGITPEIWHFLLRQIKIVHHHLILLRGYLPSEFDIFLHHCIAQEQSVVGREQITLQDWVQREDIVSGNHRSMLNVHHVEKLAGIILEGALY